MTTRNVANLMDTVCRLGVPACAIPVILFLTAIANDALAYDWPTYRGNAQRTAFIEQELAAEHWNPAWTHVARTRPTPAWPAPARASLWQRLDNLAARITDNHADIPLLAHDRSGTLHLLIASSATNCLTSYDPQTGKQRWRYIATAPLRYAPTVVEGRVYGGGDDGRVYAIDLSNGTVLWQPHIGPPLPWIIGNGRPISPHPIRTSVLVRDGKVYAHAGLFPSQGVYAVALDTETGELIWRRRVERSPQGYLLAGDSRLIVPTGRGIPYAIDATSGLGLGELPASSGTFCMLTPDALFAGPGNQGTIDVRTTTKEPQLLTFDSQAIAAGDGHIWYSDGQQLHCQTIESKDGQLTTESVWSVDCHNADQLIVSGTRTRRYAFVAVKNTIQIFNAMTGDRLSELSCSNADTVFAHLAISSHEDHDYLVGSTRNGDLYCWHSTPSGNSKQRWSIAESASDSKPSTTTNARPPLPFLTAMPSEFGFALILDDDDGQVAASLLQQTKLSVLAVVSDASKQARLAERFVASGDHGNRITIHVVDPAGSLPFTDRLFNVVINASKHIARDQNDAWRALAESGGLLVEHDLTTYRVRPALVGADSWRHQYATPANHAATRDQLVGTSQAFRLQWFGSVGPSRMPDRHLRGPAPLAAGNTMIVHGDGILIGVDPANGTERWELKLPAESVRYVMPYDAGFSSLSPDGHELLIAVGEELWRIDAHKGLILDRIAVPQRDRTDHQWGYLAEFQGATYATLMKRSARRFSDDRTVLREQLVDADYRSRRPLVCSRIMFKLTRDGQPVWRYESQGLIAHGSISLASSRRIIFIEGRSNSCRTSKTDQALVATIMEDGHLVCIDADDGHVLWERELQLENAQNMLFTQVADDLVTLVTSVSHEEDEKAEYSTQVRRLDDGQIVWSKLHRQTRKGLGHGEQVQHPVILTQPTGDQFLVVEPYCYELSTGRKTGPPGLEETWALSRPGHGCGTLSGSGHCLFFRASNPTVLNLSKPAGRPAYTKLSPSRPSCWINMLPATGRLLIPEGSASCVCNFSLQTSMAFLPIPADGEVPDLTILDDVIHIDTQSEPLRLLYDWRFSPAPPTVRQFESCANSLALTPLEQPSFTKHGLKLNGTQWLTISHNQPKLPDLPRTISLVTAVTLDDGNEKWTGFVSAIQDNGDFERGFFLGLNEGYYCFGISSAATGRLTYLRSATRAEIGNSHQLVATYDGEAMKLFVDGQLSAISTAQRGSIQYDPQSWLAVGAYQDDNESYPLRGSIRRLRIYQGAIPDQDVLEVR